MRTELENDPRNKEESDSSIVFDWDPDKKEDSGEMQETAILRDDQKKVRSYRWMKGLALLLVDISVICIVLGVLQEMRNTQLSSAGIEPETPISFGVRVDGLDAADGEEVPAVTDINIEETEPEEVDSAEFDSNEIEESDADYLEDEEVADTLEEPEEVEPVLEEDLEELQIEEDTSIIEETKEEVISDEEPVEEEAAELPKDEEPLDETEEIIEETTDEAAIEEETEDIPEAEEVVPEEPEVKKYVVVTSTALAVRGDSNVDSSTVGYLLNGDKLECTDDTSFRDWIEVIFKDKKAYVNRYYVDVIEE